MNITPLPPQFTWFLKSIAVSHKNFATVPSGRLHNQLNSLEIGVLRGKNEVGTLRVSKGGLTFVGKTKSYWNWKTIAKALENGA